MKFKKTITHICCLCLVSVPLAGRAQQEENWTYQTSIEVDLSVSDLAPSTTAIVISCEIYPRSPAAYAGTGYAVVFDPARHESPENNITSEGEFMLDRIAFEPVQNLVSEGASQTVNVPIYGNEVDFRFWDRGMCDLNLYFSDVNQISGDSLQGTLPVPVDCSEFSGEEFYRIADWCAFPGFDLSKTSFYFTREGINFPEGSSWGGVQQGE